VFRFSYIGIYIKSLGGQFGLVFEISCSSVCKQAEKYIHFNPFQQASLFFSGQ
jgi:hypothetical protein